MTVTTILKANGDRVRFSKQKVITSLLRSGASAKLATAIANQVANEITPRTTTDDIYAAAYQLLRESGIDQTATRYSLKRAIHALGPTGFPFEQFVARIFAYQGMHTQTDVIVDGACITHEIDVLATNDTKAYYIECKFHTDPSYTTDIKVPLYIHSRFRDIEHNVHTAYVHLQQEAWIVTNTRFSDDAKHYAACNGIRLVSWAYPKEASLKQMIETVGIYPITILTTLRERERIQLFDIGTLLCFDILEQPQVLADIGIPQKRHRYIVEEAQLVCSMHTSIV
jgi:hypothetical protein